MWKKGTLKGTDFVRTEESEEWTPLAKLLSLPSSNPISPENEESRSEKEKRPIADRPIYQNTVTSIGGKSKSPDERTEPVATPSSPQSTRTSVVGKSTIFWGTLAAILAAIAILFAVRFIFFTPIFKYHPKNTAVDVIDGYKSLKLGMPIQQVRSRIQPTNNKFVSHFYSPPNQQYGDSAYFEVVNMLPEKKEWGGFEIKEITLLFRYGFLIAIRVALPEDEDALLLKGFTKKYGKPTDSSFGGSDHGRQATGGYDVVWRGNETQVTFDLGSNSVMFESKVGRRTCGRPG